MNQSQSPKLPFKQNYKKAGIAYASFQHRWPLSSTPYTKLSRINPTAPNKASMSSLNILPVIALYQNLMYNTVHTGEPVLWGDAVHSQPHWKVHSRRHWVSKSPWREILQFCGSVQRILSQITRIRLQLY